VRVQIVSDAHAEQHRDLGVSFVAGLKEAGGDDVDVLVAAGDMGSKGNLFRVLSACCDAWPTVVFVPGNHEFYGGDRRSVMADIKTLEKENPNLVVLDDAVAEIQGVRFVGGTLWFPDTPDSRVRAGHFSDFGAVKGLREWVWDANRKTTEFLRRNVRPGDVVVTHHVPVARGSARHWVGSFLQPFFVNDLDRIVVENRPGLWVYGHTHDSHDFVLAETRFVCNPFGYVNSDEQRPNPDFSWGLVVPVGEKA